MPSRSRCSPPEPLACGVRHWAEELARRTLEGRGWRFLDGNAVVPGAELDLVMRDGRTLVFVEVRQRRTSRFGGPGETLTPRKTARLRRGARSWTYARYGTVALSMRIDAVLVHGDRGRHHIEHLENIA